jgi:hypothetical protein
MEQESINKEIRFSLNYFIDHSNQEKNEFFFKAEKEIEWREERIKKIYIYLKNSHKPLIEEIRNSRVWERVVIIIHNPWMVEKKFILWWDGEVYCKRLVIGSYNSESGEIVYGYDDITLKKLIRIEFLVGGGAIVAFFVAIVLVFRWIYQKKTRDI